MTVNSEIKSAVKSKNLIMGSRTVIKSMKNDNLSTVVYASNCPDEMLKDLNHYSKISGIRFEKFDGNSVQLGEICGKPFKILVVGIKKGKK
jgi:large subunit ribosomal protein L30e